METLKFKTNINCGGCIAKITPFLDQDKHISKWEVDTTTPQKILTVQANGTDIGSIINIIAAAGFKAEQV